MIQSNHYDVIVVGAGPAGSTSAALLAEKGHRVLLIEKEKFPRYHVGESLMPFCYFTLKRLGLVDQMDQLGFTKKLSVQFVTQDGKKSQPFYFFQHYDHPSSTTWQVNRDEFDHLIMNKARENGATVLEETKVSQFIKDDTGQIIGVSAKTSNGPNVEYYASVTVDATGRDAMTIAKNRWRERDPKLNKIALWTYYKGAKRDEGLDAGSTTVAYIPEKGWFWYIPLKDDIVSLGIVGDRDYLYRDTRELSEIFDREIKTNAWIEDHISCGEQFGDYWATGEYSYRSRYCAQDGLVLVGDAFAFLDPVFSSGVFFALKSGEFAADAIDRAIQAKDFSAGQFDAYGTRMCESIELMRKIVYAFYDEAFSFGKLIRKHPDLRPDLTGLPHRQRRTLRVQRTHDGHGRTRRDANRAGLRSPRAPQIRASKTNAISQGSLAWREEILPKVTLTIGMSHCSGSSRAVFHR